MRQDNANNGVNVAEEVAKQLGSIQDSSTKVNTLISEIAAASYLTSSRSLKVIVHTLQSVFPHLTAWTSGSVGDMIFLAGKGGPLEIDYQKFLERVRRPEVKQDLLRVGLQPELVPFELFVMDEEELGAYRILDFGFWIFDC